MSGNGLVKVSVLRRSERSQVPGPCRKRDGLVDSKIYAEIPVRVEYSLTPLGWTMTEPLIALSEWGEVHSKEVTEARAHYRNDTSSLGSSRIAQSSAAA